MTAKTKHITLQSIFGVVLVLFLMPFTTRSDGYERITNNGLESVMGLKSPINLTHNVKDTKTGAIHEVTFGDTKPEPFATIAAIAALLALVFSFFKGNIGRIFPFLCIVACAISLFILKVKLGQEVSNQGFGIISVQWKWGFWLAFLLSIVASVISCLPIKLATSQIEKKQSPLSSKMDQASKAGGVSLNIRESEIKNQLKLIRSKFSILENAYVASNISTGPKEMMEIEKALSEILSEGDIGSYFLLERLFEGVTFSGNNISLHNWGEETFNELIKKQIIIKALGAAKVKVAIPKLEKLSKANCNYGQWRECIVGPLSLAITAINS